MNAEAKKEAEPEVKVVEVKKKALHPTKFLGAEFVRTLHVANPEVGTPYADVLEPEYWVHIASRLRPFDRIEVVPEDGSYFAELFVQDAGRLWAKVVEPRFVSFETIEKNDPLNGYEIKWRGSAKWGVVRLSDNTAMKDGFSSKGEAEKYIRAHVKALAS